MNTQQIFPKKEHLYDKTAIESLYGKGHRMMFFPYSIYWDFNDRTIDDGNRSRVLITTSKRKFHHAVDRNRVKRLTRECYRQHRPQLWEYLEKQDLHIDISFNYIHTEIFRFQTLYAKFDKIIPELIKAIEHSR